jgi:Fe-Mn family superoxide dismutase
MAFTLPPLPYAYSALEPYIDTRTMEIHHDKHHQAYVDNLNKALEGYPELQDKTLSELLKNLEAIPEAIRTAVRNNGGGDSNHTLFWNMMKPQGGGEPQGRLADEINKRFGSFAVFQDEFNTAAKKRFGSGWAWLIVNQTGDLEVISSANQDTPVSNDQRPLLGLDVWEHAYYLKYQNRRPDYINAWWHVVNWEAAYELFEKSGF